LALFTCYCETWGRYAHFSRKLAESGDLVMEVGENGYRQASPELSELRKAQEDLMKLASRFGLSPSDRTRIDVQPEPDPKNPFTNLKKDSLGA
jgi:P27 family predicted phage terminase small subunit